MNSKYNPIKSTLDTYNYKRWFKESNGSTLKGDEEEWDHLLPKEADKEVKEGKGIKILTPSKLLTRLPVLLAQSKAIFHLIIHQN